MIGCGINNDILRADDVDDVNPNCETVERGGGPDTRSGDVAAPAFSASASKKLKLRKVLSKGLPVTLECDEACSVSATSMVKGAGTVAKGKKALSAAGKGKLVLKFTKKARKNLARKRSVKLTVRMTAVDAAGNTSNATGTITVKR